jgi:hypothetical protein
MAAPVVTWAIAQLETAPSEDGLTDVVKTAHWTVSATEVDGDKTYTAGAYGSVGFSAPDPATFTDYADITEAEAIGWVKDALGSEQVVAIGEGLLNQIENQKNPPIEVLPLPWNS